MRLTAVTVHHLVKGPEGMLRRTDNGKELIPPLTVPEKPKRKRGTAPSYDRVTMRVALCERDNGKDGGNGA